MSDPISFRGALHHWTLGEPPRLELVCVPSDNAIAQSIALLKGRELSLAIHYKDDKVCTLSAALPPISTVVGKFGKATKVKLDVYPNDMPSFLSAIRLADGDGMMRFEFLPGAPQSEKPKREAKPAKEPTPYGKFWQEMDKAGFHNRHDVRTWINAHDLMEAATKERMRKAWRVTSRANEMSPDDVVAWLMDQPESHGAITMVRKIAAGHWQHNI